MTYKITVAFGWTGDPSEMPTVVSAYSEYDFDIWGGVPDWHRENVAGTTETVREVVIAVPEQAVTNLFKPPPVAAVVATVIPDEDDPVPDVGPDPVVLPPADRSAGRWCSTCQAHGDHHTDRHAVVLPRAAVCNNWERWTEDE